VAETCDPGVQTMARIVARHVEAVGRDAAAFADLRVSPHMVRHRRACDKLPQLFFLLLQKFNAAASPR
jgi:hypothetical protein